MVSAPDFVGHVGIGLRPAQGVIAGIEVVFDSHIAKVPGL
ncbi:hypothetical protein A2U01_0099393, partial [Trifolium medium]|nr:hypothetical protein [Trifolium medium]